MMKTQYALPPNYSRYAVIDPSNDHRFIVGATLAGMVLFIGCGWLLVQLADSLRPAALDGIRLRDMLVSTPTGTSLILHPGLFRDAAIALVSVLILHELTHGLFYWWFSKSIALAIRLLFSALTLGSAKGEYDSYNKSCCHYADMDIE